MRSLISALLLGTIATGHAQEATTEPSWAPTGRLSQFRGFASPKPHGIPSNAQMMYASVWAGWSAWSFCSNGVRIRVRACNTVKGFSCLGPNQERRPCSAVHSSHHGARSRANTDYDVVDPWEADRREAMNQLYPDSSEENDNFVQLRPAPHQSFRAHSAGPTSVQAPIGNEPSTDLDDSLILFEETQIENLKDGAPGADPEKMFGARTFELKENEHKERKHKPEVEELTASSNLESNFRHNWRRPGDSKQKHLKKNEKTAKKLHTFSSSENQATSTPKIRTTTTAPTTTTTSTTPIPETVTPIESPATVASTTSPVEEKPAEIPDGFEDITDFRSIQTTTEPDSAEQSIESIDHVTVAPDFHEDLMERIEDGTKVFGDNPVLVKPTVTESQEEEETFEEVKPTLSTVPRLPPIVSRYGHSFARPSLHEAELVRAMKTNAERNGVQVIAPKITEKKRGFGITGFAIKKSGSSREVLHFGEVTTTPKKKSQELPDQGAELSPDTLNALDWMLNNMTQAAAEEDREFLKVLSEAQVSPMKMEADLNEPALHLTPPSQSRGKVSAGRKHKKHRKIRKFKKSRAKNQKLHYGDFKPANMDPAKMFPKFRARPVQRGRSRAMGVRTVIADKDTDNTPASSPIVADILNEDSEDPEQLLEEINKLQAMMKNVESDMETLDSQEFKESSFFMPESFKLRDDKLSDTAQKLDDVKGSYRKKTLSATSETAERDDSNDYKNIFHESSMLRIISPSQENAGGAEWSDWSVWGTCFCGKQLRTRICKYGVASDGCQGQSHESRECEGGFCPTRPSMDEFTTTFQPRTVHRSFTSIHNSRREFRPHRLQPASSLL